MKMNIVLKESEQYVYMNTLYEIICITLLVFRAFCGNKKLTDIYNRETVFYREEHIFFLIKPREGVFGSKLQSTMYFSQFGACYV